MARPRITVVGLGPAGEDMLTPTARELVTSATAAFLRTERHPAAAAFADSPAGAPSEGHHDGARGFTTFDHHYDAAESFDDVYRRIVADLVAAAQRAATDGGEVVYAVPGSPLVAERTVEMLREDPRVEVSVVPAMSFLDLAWASLGVDPVSSGVRLVDGTRFATDAAGERGPLLVAQCWSPAVLSDVKLVLGESDLADDATVTVLHHLGLPDEVVCVLPWHELDRAVVPDHLTSLWIPKLAAPVAGELAALDELVRRLRRDCPWDRQQTHASLARHLLEEAYEVLEAIDAISALDDAASADATRAAVTPHPVVGEDDAIDAERRATLHLEEELGDLLFQVFLHSRLAAEQGRFTVADVARGLHDKLVSRHPHVFGDVAAHDAATVVANWEDIKKREKGRASVTEGIPAALPALALAAKLQRKSLAIGAAAPPAPAETAARARSLLDALVSSDPVAGTPSSQTGRDRADGDEPAPDPEAAGDAGELLWLVADLVRRRGIDPEDALRAAAGRHRAAIVDAEARAASVADQT